MDDRQTPFNILRCLEFNIFQRLDFNMMRRLEASPTFSGVPVAATFLMHQAQTPFENAFPGLEMSAVFSMHNTQDFSYTEFAKDPESVFSRLHMRIFGASEAQVSVPVYERLSQAEEERLGASGIRKAPVGTLIMKGMCRVGCAQVKLMQVTLTKTNGDVVWTWNASDSTDKKKS
jgi:hypothetical protein